MQKAVNVDEGLVENMRGAEAQIALIAKRKEEEEKAKASEPKDVEDDEWD